VPLLEIRKHQNGQHENRTKHLDLVPTQLLMEIVTEVGGDMKKDLRFQQSALGALQAAAESFYVKHLEGM
jgi:histone H3/H4